MRPPRLVVLLAGCLVLPAFLITLFSIFTRSSRQHASTARTTTNRASGFKALFSFHSPSSLFPPSALISLTDDNSTFFLARPAAFGPLLPSEGFSGQLWVGSGFGDDTARRGGGGSALGAEGELGCSDLPDWGDNNPDRTSENAAGSAGGAAGKVQGSSENQGGDRTKLEGGQNEESAETPADGKSSSTGSSTPSEEDGTDDHLHHPRPGTDVIKPKGSERSGSETTKSSKGGSRQHADIQSLQEGAEISGKIVLLSRGGCGFLEKAKWVQRRGGTALIVGDDTRGGVLFTMYASGDTSNITIPSLFTSHTTAQLLSSLTSPNRFGGSKTPGSPNRSKEGSLLRAKLDAKKKSKAKGATQGPTFTATTTAIRATSTPTAGSKTRDSGVLAADSPFQIKERESWLHSVLAKIGIRSGNSAASDLGGDSRRPPSSGQLDWVLVDDWNDEDMPDASTEKGSNPRKGEDKAGKTRRPTKSSRPTPTKANEPGKGDDFVIGVQDWRDPDLVGAAPSKDTATGRTKSTTTTSKSTGANVKSTKTAVPPANKAQDASRGKEHGKDQGKPNYKGGSITPGSGEYGKPGKDSAKGNNKNAAGDSPTSSNDNSNPPAGDSSEKGWFGHLSWNQDETKADGSSDAKPGDKPSGLEVSAEGVAAQGASDEEALAEEEHEGLWVTLTPTSMSSSPFFDTLLVLVISPLITLTVVYALLLLRSRIRRRRWRAPKAVVERLPVRTYHTLSSPSGAASSRYATSHATSPGSPLLQSSPSTPRPRPRSHTTSAVHPETDVARSRPILIHEPPLPSEAEKPVMASSEYRRRYTGKQVECVVCLEEYVDGISRVMSLPCGHEFHVDCITPWLTTRRRTCPICKGDVVRSLAHGSPASGPSARYQDEPDEDILSPDTESRARALSAAAVAAPDRTEEENADLERGSPEMHESFVHRARQHVDGPSWMSRGLLDYQPDDSGRPGTRDEHRARD